MFIKKIIKVPLFALVLLLSFTLIFLASCKLSVSDELEEISQADVAKGGDDGTEEEMIEEDTEDAKISSYSFNNAVKTPHWVDNVPTSNTILPGVPVNVIINFNFDLYEGSKIIIENDGIQYNTGDATIDENNLTLRVGMDPESPDGLYEVRYSACWPDGSCHDGSFEFAIDSKMSENLVDLRGSNEVTINMENISFDMPQIIIDKGTTVTWVNLEDAGHYINTDPHPGHNYYPEQNSELLSKGDSYYMSFDMPGLYPYHCSAHYSTMQGMILVE